MKDLHRRQWEKMNLSVMREYEKCIRPAYDLVGVNQIPHPGALCGWRARGDAVLHKDMEGCALSKIGTVTLRYTWPTEGFYIQAT
jgi:hypothetical protein